MWHLIFFHIHPVHDTLIQPSCLQVCVAIQHNPHVLVLLEDGKNPQKNKQTKINNRIMINGFTKVF